MSTWYFMCKEVYNEIWYGIYIHEIIQTPKYGLFPIKMHIYFAPSI